MIASGGSATSGSGSLTINAADVLIPGGLHVGACEMNGSDGWFRSTGSVGWYSTSYGGGIHMTDSTWVRVYGTKRFYCEQSIYSSYGFLGLGRRKAYTTNVTIAKGGSLSIYHNLGYDPIVTFAGSLGTIIMNISYTDSTHVSIFNSGTSSVAWTGDVNCW